VSPVHDDADPPHHRRKARLRRNTDEGSTRLCEDPRDYGMTQPPRSNARNERAKDLVDVLLLHDQLADMAAIRSVCVAVFEMRGTHAWPPDLEVHEHWRDEFEKLVSEYGLAVEGLEAGVAEARTLILRIDASWSAD